MSLELKNCVATTTLAACALCAALVAPKACAQAAPSSEQMIEQLKKPQSRSLRNLSVEAVSPKAAEPTAPIVEAKPSLSLLIQFDLNSARVKPESQQALANLAVALKSQELLSARFAVEGHTDATGRADHNQRLSQQRADAVRDVLTAQGVAQQRLLTAGKGSTELVNSADPASFENRRVRIVNLE